MPQIITVASFKGGVAKTTTAVHFAAYFQERGPTLLIDTDPNRSVIRWNRAGALPFTVTDETGARGKLKEYDFVVVDTVQRPTPEDLAELVKRGPLVIPAAPRGLDTHALSLTLAALKPFGRDSYRVLLTMVPPPPEQEGPELRAYLTGQGVPVFAAEIPRLKVYDKAASLGVLVNQVPNDRNAKRAWEAYAAAGKELIP